MAYFKAVCGKQCKQEVRAYIKHLDDNLCLLQHQINTGKVDVGHYHYFRIFDPKERLICASSFSERVLHHAIMNVCHPYLDKTLIDDTYATRIGKGTYKAIERAREGCRKYTYVAKLDVRKYFDSVCHHVLKEQLRHIFKDKCLLSIFDRIIDSYETTDSTGIPIGNLTSQYFANLYLSGIDHKAKEEWKVPMYVRYMDDILLYGNDKDILKEQIRLLFDAMQYIGLTLKPIQILRTEQGVQFLGYRLYPHKILLSGRSKRRFQHKLHLYNTLFYQGEMSEEDYLHKITPLYAFAYKAYSARYKKRLCIEGRTA